MSDETSTKEKKWIIYHENSGDIAELTGSIIIGRHELCDIVLSDSTRISRKSISITRANDSCILEVLGKSPVTYKKLLVSDECNLYHSDKFDLCHHSFYLFDENNVRTNSELKKLEKNRFGPSGCSIEKLKWNLVPKFNLLFCLSFLPSFLLSLFLAFLLIVKSVLHGLSMLITALIIFYLVYTFIIYAYNVIKNKYVYPKLVLNIVMIFSSLILSVTLSGTLFKFFSKTIDYDSIWLSECNNEKLRNEKRSQSCFQLGMFASDDQIEKQTRYFKKSCELKNSRICEDGDIQKLILQRKRYHEKYKPEQQ